MKKERKAMMQHFLDKFRKRKEGAGNKAAKGISSQMEGRRGKVREGMEKRPKPKFYEGEAPPNAWEGEKRILPKLKKKMERKKLDGKKKMPIPDKGPQPIREPRWKRDDYKPGSIKRGYTRYAKKDEKSRRA